MLDFDPLFGPRRSVPSLFFIFFSMECVKTFDFLQNATSTSPIGPEFEFSSTKNQVLNLTCKVNGKWTFGRLKISRSQVCRLGKWLPIHPQTSPSTMLRRKECT